MCVSVCACMCVCVGYFVSATKADVMTALTQASRSCVYVPVYV